MKTRFELTVGYTLTRMEVCLLSRTKWEFDDLVAYHKKWKESTGLTTSTAVITSMHSLTGQGLFCTTLTGWHLTALGGHLRTSYALLVAAVAVQELKGLPSIDIDPDLVPMWEDRDDWLNTVF